MKKIFSFALAGIVFFSCSKKEDNSSFVPSASSTTATPSAPVEANPAPETAAKPELKKEGDMSLPGYALINGADCLTCHKSDAKLIGPSYEEVAKKYSEKDVNMLAEKIVKGGKGVWGEAAMTPHPNISNEDAKKMVEYILTLKK